MPHNKYQILAVLLLATTNACMPPTGYGQSYYYPYSGGYAAHGTSAYRAGVNPIANGILAGPYRSEANLDAISSASELNCRLFEETCRWSNTNEDEFDWKVRASSPEAERFLTSLGASSMPDISSAVLTSAKSNGWEAGQLISDEMSCMPTALQLTATVWRSAGGAGQQSVYDLPNLQVCSRNVRQRDEPPTTCTVFPTINGVPATVSIPLPKDPYAPTQIIVRGDNFAGAEGGAIFLQDVFVDGHIEPDCSMAALDKPQPPDLLQDHSTGLEPVRLDTLVNSGLSTMTANSGLSSLTLRSQQRLADRASKPPLLSKSLQVVSPETLFEACIALSCNPAESECKWHSGRNGWVKASGRRASNPLTGVLVPPPGVSSFLVAPLTAADHLTSYQMTSVPIDIPHNSRLNVHFCFYEYFATDGMRLALCMDDEAYNCFYSRTDINMGKRIEDNRRWNFRCVRLPSGSYKVSVVAENRGANQGEVGFAPVRLASDPSGVDALC